MHVFYSGHRILLHRLWIFLLFILQCRLKLISWIYYAHGFLVLIFHDIHSRRILVSQDSGEIQYHATSNRQPVYSSETSQNGNYLNSEISSNLNADYLPSRPGLSRDSQSSANKGPLAGSADANFYLMSMVTTRLRTFKLVL